MAPELVTSVETGDRAAIATLTLAFSSDPVLRWATSERSRDLYARHGFEVLGVIQAGVSPPMWPMLRQPRV
jgi:hypothetical protein